MSEHRHNHAVLVALDAACSDESGGWAGAYHVGRKLDRDDYAAIGHRLALMERHGLVESWEPIAGRHSSVRLYRRGNGAQGVRPQGAPFIGYGYDEPFR